MSQRALLKKDASKKHLFTPNMKKSFRLDYGGILNKKKNWSKGI